MLELRIRCFWGPRQESAAEVAGRLGETLSRLRVASPEVFDRQWFTKVDSPDAFPLTLKDLTAHVSSGNKEGDEAYAGFTTSLSAKEMEGQPEVTILVSAGGVMEYVNNSVVTTVRGSGSSRPNLWAAHFSNALLAQGEAWQADYGNVSETSCDKAVRTSRGIKRSDPRGGYATYLSPSRYKLVSANVPIPGRRLPTRDGGAVITILGEGSELPPADDVVTFDGILRAFGALAAQPRPMKRANL